MPPPQTLQFWRNICNQYHSFSRNRTYTNLLDRTASGLLADVLAKTTTENKKMHFYSLEVFAAFCMYTAVKKFADHKRRLIGENANDIADDVLEKLYKRILNYLKRNNVQGVSCTHLRNTIGLATDNLVKDEIRKELSQRSYCDQKGEKIVTRVRRNFSIDGELSREFDEELATPGVWEEIVEGGYKLLQDHERYRMLEQAILTCREKEIISEEAFMNICYFFGIGDGYPHLKNKEIAEKLGKSDGYVSRQRNQALKKIEDFIRQNKELRDAII